MNPMPIAAAMLWRYRVTLGFFVVLIAFAIALGLSLTMLERALRQGSARASDQFDLVVGAPGSVTDLVLSAVYLRTSSLPLVTPEAFAEALAAEQANFVAPIAFGDRVGFSPVIGTTADLVASLSPDLAEGSIFAARDEAVVGASVAVGPGETIQPAHAHGGADLPVTRMTVVGRMAPTGTPWDNAVIVPIEQYWLTHDLPVGHPPGDESIGPPFDVNHLAGVPAIVIDAANIGSAYGLRNQFRSEATTAVFPAEVLVELYGFMADGRAVLLWVVTAVQGLILVAIIAGLALIVQLNAGRLALLRALGAPRLFVASAVWTFSLTVIVAGVLLGLVAGVLATLVLGQWAQAELGIALPFSLTREDVELALLATAAAALLSVVPALASYRRNPVAALSH